MSDSTEHTLENTEVSELEKTQEFEVVGEKGADAAPTDAYEADEIERYKKRQGNLIAGSIFAAVILVLAALVVGSALSGDDPNIRTIDDSNTPLSSGTDEEDTDKDKDATDSSDDDSDADTSTGSSNGIGSNSGNTGGDPSGNTNGNNSGGTSNQTWVPAWDEQVWVDTSGYQSVYVGENPIYGPAMQCNTCNETLFSDPWAHINTFHNGVGGFRDVVVQVGSTPVYETQWVPSGYWTTVHHEGYWK